MTTSALNPQLGSSLECLGLTPLEADVYGFLVQASPATGYRVAQALGKSVGMIYKAVESLEAKGAAMSADDGESRVIRAVPVADFIAQVRRQIDEACISATRALSTAPVPEPDDRLYRLTSREQVMQRAFEMFSRAERFAIVNATPGPAANLHDWMTSATAKGVRVAMKAFEPTALDGVDVRQDARGERAVRSAPGEWLLMTVDGRDVLVALFEHATGVLHAGYWTQNPLLAWTMFSGMSADFTLADVRQAVAAGLPAVQIQSRLDAMAAYEAPDSVGKLTLLSAYRRPAPARLRRNASQSE